MNCKNALPIPVALCLGNLGNNGCSGDSGGNGSCDCGGNSNGNSNCGGNGNGNGNGDHSCNHPNITLTDEISLDRSDIAASAKAVKKAVTKAEIELDTHIADTSHHETSFDAHNADANAHKVLLNPIKASLNEHDAEINAQALALTEHKNDLIAHGNTGGNGGGTLSGAYLGEYKEFNERILFSGWAVRNGAVLDQADVRYPELWAYLQKIENAWKCKTETEWQALLHDDGMGGANAFVLDTTARTIRLPDTRGDYIAGSGWNDKQAGDSEGDAIRNIVGDASRSNGSKYKTAGYFEGRANSNTISGAFKVGTATTYMMNGVSGVAGMSVGFDASRVVPTDIRNHPATMYQLPCVYIGLPACPSETEVVPTPEAELITA